MPEVASVQTRAASLSYSLRDGRGELLDPRRHRTREPMQRRRPAKGLGKRGRIHRRDPRGVEVPDPPAELGRAGERLLDRHLLVELEADEQGQRVGHEQSVGLVVTGEGQSVEGRRHGRMVALLRSGHGRRPPPDPRPAPARCRRRHVAPDRRILVRDGRIEAILAPDDAAPTDAMLVPLAGDWIVPGLIDCHTHLVGEMEYAGIPAVDASAAQEAMSGVRNARATLRAGFTTVRDVGTFRAFVDVALRDAIDRGWTPGPRMQCAGAYITAPGGGGEVTGDAPTMDLPDDLRFGVVRDAEDVRRKVRALADGGATVIKCIVTGAVLTRGTQPGVVELDGSLVAAAVEEAARHGLFVAAHAHGTDGIKVAIRAGVRSVEHGSLIDGEGIAMLVAAGTYLVMDVYDGDWIAEEGRRAGWPAETLAKNELTTQAQRDGFRQAVRAGVKLAYGTDSGVYPHAKAAIQLGYQVHLGQTPLEAIRSATLVASELLGWEDRVGSLQVGRFADLVAVDADPLADIDVLRQPASVVKGGVPVD